MTVKVNTSEKQIRIIYLITHRQLLQGTSKTIESW